MHALDVNVHMANGALHTPNGHAHAHWSQESVLVGDTTMDGTLPEEDVRAHHASVMVGIQRGQAGTNLVGVHAARNGGVAAGDGKRQFR